jgi:integral membrane protein (TIGR01906 family)
MNRAHSALSWLVAILVPITLIGLGVRLLLTPLYLQLEYRLPGFPADMYGFSTDERIRWGTYGIRYLLNDAPPSYLGVLRLNTGKPLFGERELAHMQDVKLVVSQVLRSWCMAISLMAILLAWAWRSRWLAAYRHGLRLGGWLTLACAATAGLLGSIGASGSGELFWKFFSAFHGIFFSGDSWLFAYSDTLIRLYPLRFWQDTVVYIGVLAALGAAMLALGLREPSTPTDLRS